MNKAILLFAIFISTFVFSQNASKDTIATNQQQNAVNTILSSKNSKVITIGGYGQVDYNQPEGKNGKLDVHRFIIFLGYKFSDRVQFVTEIEFEHVKELFVEQAFLSYSVPVAQLC